MANPLLDIFCLSKQHRRLKHYCKKIPPKFRSVSVSKRPTFKKEIKKGPDRISNLTEMKVAFLCTWESVYNFTFWCSKGASKSLTRTFSLIKTDFKKLMHTQDPHELIWWCRNNTGTLLKCLIIYLYWGTQIYWISRFVIAQTVLFHKDPRIIYSLIITVQYSCFLLTTNILHLLYLHEVLSLTFNK